VGHRGRALDDPPGHGGGALFPITDLDSALLAIEDIVEQGERTHTSTVAPVGFDRDHLAHLEPYGFQGALEPAHYWRFLDIVEGRTPIGDVHPMRVAPSSGDLPEGELRDLSRLFDACYSLQLDVMERSGAPAMRARSSTARWSPS